MALFISVLIFIPFSFLDFIYSLITFPILLYLCIVEFFTKLFKGAEIVFFKLKLKFGYSSDIEFTCFSNLIPSLFSCGINDILFFEKLNSNSF